MLRLSDEPRRRGAAPSARNLRDYCRFYHGRDVTDATMVGIDCDGFDVRANAGLLRFAFEGLVHSAEEARAVLVEMAKKARGA